MLNKLSTCDHSNINAHALIMMAKSWLVREIYGTASCHCFKVQPANTSMNESQQHWSRYFRIDNKEGGMSFKQWVLIHKLVYLQCKVSKAWEGKHLVMFTAICLVPSPHKVATKHSLTPANTAYSTNFKLGVVEEYHQLHVADCRMSGRMLSPNQKFLLLIINTGYTCTMQEVVT